MADQISHVQGHHVVLPWAPQTGWESEDHTAAARARKDQFEIRVGDARLTMEGDGDRDGTSHAPRTRLLDGRLAAMGLPVAPSPTISDQDRGFWSDERVVSLAVALDVLATMTRGLRPTSVVLQQLAQALLHTGELGGAGLEIADGLLAYAGSETGRNRGRLSHRLAACMTLAAGTPVQWPATVSTPSSVIGAVRNLEAMTELVVRDAVLLLQTHAPVDYWQA